MKDPTLGGSVFVRNALKYDYCIKESIESLAALCDDVFVLDCQSDDGTTAMLAEFVKKFPNVRYQTNGDWNCKADYHKLAELANACIKHLNTDWHIMLQADEVLHEECFPVIRSLIKTAPKTVQTYALRRLNLFGTVDKHISFSMSHKPCSDQPVRLGRRGLMATGDAEALEWKDTDRTHIDEILIYHYGYVRKSEININKAVDMQSWFFGDKSSVDGRLLDMQKTGVWEPYKLIPENMLTAIPRGHPKFSAKWAEERR